MRTKTNSWPATISIALALFLALSGGAGAAGAQEGSASGPEIEELDEFAEADDLDDGDLDDELLLFEDIPVVLSASRQPTPVNRTAVPISVITAEEIHASGKVNIDELLRSIPGMDVLHIDRNRPSIGVRGLHDYFSDRTLVLIDGMSANNPIFGGIDLRRLPINIEDIEKIEVVRGPGGAAWGANAYTGVINIILKAPEDTPGVLGSITLNEFGDVTQQTRIGGTSGDWRWRVSLGFDDWEPSSDALAGEDFVSDDRNLEGQFSFSASRSLSEASSLKFGGGYSRSLRGTMEFLALPAAIEPGAVVSSLSTARAHVRWDHQFRDGREASLQWNAQHLNDDFGDTSEYWVLENTLEGQLTTNWGDGHRTTLGSTFRLINADTEKNGPQQLGIQGGAFHEEGVGLFLVDRWRATNRTVVELQARGDYYSGTGFDSSGRATALISLDPDERSIARFSLAKAFRAPQSIMRKATLDRFPLPAPAPPGLFGLSLSAADDLENEEIYSIEAGLTRQLSRTVEFRVDTYWQRLNRLISARVLPDPFSLGRTLFQIDNSGNANAYGTEAELSVALPEAIIVGWYAYTELDTDKTTQTIRAYGPARHKVGLRASTEIGDDWELHGSYTYTSTTRDPGNLSPSVPEHHVLDLSVLWQWTDQIEFTVGVSDLFDELSDFEVGSQGTTITHESPGRTVFIRAQVEF